MKKILIFPSEKYQFCENYIKACYLAGFEPTYTETFLDCSLYDALLIPGGRDVDPSLYGEDNKGSVDFDKEIDQKQLKVVDDFFKAGKPILGICRGSQLLNVYFGGSLKQDIVGHRLDDNKAHRVLIKEGSILEEFSKNECFVNSTHHQCYDSLGKGLNLIAKSEDGVPESFIHDNGKVLGIQWHPEKMLDDEKYNGLEIYKLFFRMVDRK